jgi:hypothetical protein
VHARTPRWIVEAIAWWWCRSFEGALAALGAPLVGTIAQNVFHFPVNDHSYSCRDGQPVSSGDEQRASKATALGNAMLLCMIIPWLLCLFIYAGLHWTYPKDRRALPPRVLQREPFVCGSGSVPLDTS